MARFHPSAVLLVIALLAACSSGTSTVSSSSTAPPAEPNQTTSTIGGPPQDLPTPVIVDYSPTVSDVGGLMYLLAHPDIEVVAISLPVTGEAACDLGLEVTAGLLAMADQLHIPIACDPEIPAHAKEWPSAFLDGHEDLLFTLPDGSVQVTQDPSSLIAEAVDKAGRPVVIWAVAPLTNVARALADHPDLTNQIERIVIMGGAVDVDGNVEGTAAEWNFWIDVPAAAAVLAADVSITLVPLDATNDVPVPFWYRSALSEAPQSDSIVYLERMVRLFPSVTSGFFYLWDELAAAVIVSDAFVTTDRMSLVVGRDGPNEGRTLVTDDGRTVTVATGVVDPNDFYEDFLSTLAGGPVQVGGSATLEEENYFLEVVESLATFRSTLESLFGDPKLAEGAEFDSVHVTKVVERFLDAIEVSRQEMTAVAPPTSLNEIHREYLALLNEIAEPREQLLSEISNATGWDEADAVFEAINVFEPCSVMDAHAAELGVDIGDGVCG